MSIPRGLLAVAAGGLVALAAPWGERVDAQPRAAPAARAGTPSLPPRGATTAAPDAPGVRCLLFADPTRAATSAECRACHGSKAPGSAHPVDLEYPATAPQDRALRPLAEVVRRGVFLPDGQLRCVTCHDGRSPWAAALALPPGTAARAAVVPGEPRTYDPDLPPPPPSPGDRVSPRPLCLACHAFD